MKAIMLAAGVGSRLGSGDSTPKVLLAFAGQTLLERHVAILKAAGLESLTLGVGYKAEQIAAEIVRLNAQTFVRFRPNPDYRKGSIATLWALKDAVLAGGPVLLMDGDVLYDRRLIARLLASSHENCFLLDRDVEAGEEPVKLGVKDGRLVDFNRQMAKPHDFYGESVGFFRFSPEIAAKILAHVERRLGQDETDIWYEEAIRDTLLSEPAGTFGFEDITGLPWTEIDFPEDVRKAEEEILPKLLA
ncbi:phosphocholine cytidylyltransferase family protein [Rhodospirillaceae bacterium AH-315-P19]|nr:phosphocholine cytidylyltransferase family protein [Rhodospirillaceae bacterium AH-315-P19]